MLRGAALPAVDGRRARTSFSPLEGWDPASPTNTGYVDICLMFGWGLEVRRLLGFINLKGKKMYRITWNVYSSILTEGERKHRNITYLSPKENELVSAG